MNSENVNPGIDLDEKLQAEIEDALGDMSLDDMLDFADNPPQRGESQLKMGTIISIHGMDVFVEFGPKSQGVCPLSQFETKPESGQRLEFIVDRFDKKDGILILSRQGAVRKAEWESLGVGQTIEALCTGTNKGGLEMEVANHRAFMPAGQVDLRHIEDLSIFVGEKMPCEVIELDRQHGRIILSRRSALNAERSLLREKLLESLEVGQELPAVITSVKPYGAFADLGGVDGLIHISDMSHERLKNPSEVVKENQQVQVIVLKLEGKDSDNPNDLRIGLGMKQLLADPFQTQIDAISEGDVVSGKITKLMEFGAFVELAPGVEGLIHISEMKHERVNRVSSVVKPQEIVTVKVLKVDHDQKRISLSLKALQEGPADATSTSGGYSKSGGARDAQFERPEDPAIRKLKAKFGSDEGGLKGGIG